jgi:hypothetical protein
VEFTIPGFCALPLDTLPLEQQEWGIKALSISNEYKNRNHPLLHEVIDQSNID